MSQRAEIEGTRYVLAVKSLSISASYYQNQLGFTSIWSDDRWHFLRRGKFFVTLGECPNEKSAFDTGDHSYFGYVDVNNIDTLYHEFLSRSVDIPSKIEDKPWGQCEFSVRTVDGHRIRSFRAIMQG